MIPERKKIADMTNAEIDLHIAKVTGKILHYHNWRKSMLYADTPQNYALWKQRFGWSPTTKWGQIGSWIDRFDITIAVARENEDGTREYVAEAWGNLRVGSAIRARGFGSTRLLAICRCCLIIHYGNDI